MKRIKYFIVLFVMMFTCLINAKAVVYGTMEECRADVHSADLSSATGKALLEVVFKTIVILQHLLMTIIVFN